MKTEIKTLLEGVRDGRISVDDALLKLKTEPYEDLGFAKVDHHRGIRQGASEVIYGAGKTPEQIAAIVADMLGVGQERILITRLRAKQARELVGLLPDGLVCVAGDGCAGGDGGAGGADGDGGPAVGGDGANAPSSSKGASRIPTFTYHEEPQLATIGEAPDPTGAGAIVVACGGTSDIYAAEEAAITAEMLGNDVIRLYDVGVAGLHRLLAHAGEIARASVIVAVAGMEGALPSVIGGFASCPVIAVPTSVGYGASFDGLAALLAMLNSCASGVSVVNIDNGFGAGYQASLINHVG